MNLKLFDATPKVTKPNRLPANPEQGVGRFPSWLHRKLPKGEELFQTNAVLEKHGLNTVCEEAKCPNRLECYSKKTATFLVLGKECTRRCGFCDIDFAETPSAPDPEEPAKIAECVRDLGLQHVVITMVARDDLPDGGSAHLVKILKALREASPQLTIELLTSDFYGNFEALKSLLEEPLEVFNHNIETVRRLTPRVRNRAEYACTLEILQFAKAHSKARIKSGIMVGFGEGEDEVKETIRDLHRAGCDIITIGQYLQASSSRALVKEFVTPELFAEYKRYGEEIGVTNMYCGPFVRSSYNADLFARRVAN